MKILDDGQIRRLKNEGKLLGTEPINILQKGGDGLPMVDIAALASLIISTTEAVKAMSETNQQALKHMDNALSAIAYQPPMIPSPTLVMPPPPTAWRFDIERDNNGLIANVTAVRIEGRDDS